MDAVTPISITDSVQETLRGLSALVPMLVLAATVLIVLVMDFFHDRIRSRRVGFVAAVGTAIATCAVWGSWRTPMADVALGWGMLRADSFTWFFSLLFLVSTLIVIGMTYADAEMSDFRMGEYYALLLTATLAAMTLVASTNLVVFYLAFETLSLPSYVLAGYRKTDRQASEASLKYVLFGAVASAIMLYGLSILYGLTGTFHLADVSNLAFTDKPVSLLVLMLLLAGFGFKMSLVPFHFWTPDVYQGAPTPITAYLSVVSKAAGFAAFARLGATFVGVPHLLDLSGNLPLYGEFDLVTLFWVLAALTMIFGNFVALRQRDAKRLLAYSSIAHAGYMFMAFVAHSPSGVESLLFYFVAYAIANLGLFYGVQLVFRSRGTYDLAGFRGLVYLSPAMAAALSILLWSLIGLPPSAGFVAKWKLFYAVLERASSSSIPALYYSLVLIAVGTSVVALYYYVQIIRLMSFYRPDEGASSLRVSMAGKVALLIAAGLILIIQLNWQPLSACARFAVALSRTHVSQTSPAETSMSSAGMATTAQRHSLSSANERLAEQTP